MVDVKPHTQQYYLDIKFGTAKDTKENPTRLLSALTVIDQLYIIQDINRFLPTFRLKMQDIEGYYSNLKPYDKRQNRIRIAFSRNGLAEGATIFDFDVYRRFPDSDSLFDIEGILQIENFFKPNKIRSFNGKINNTLSTIAEEMGTSETEISSSLDLERKIVQPSCSNSKLLGYLRDNLLGRQMESPYFCYITCKNTGRGIRKVFIFKSLREFYKGAVKYTFSDSPSAYYDDKASTVYYPILDFKAYDNYKLQDVLGCKKMDYGYFDYDNSEYVLDSICVKNNKDSVDDYYSLTKYFSIDQDGSEDNVTRTVTGRNNDFTSNFKGREKSIFFDRINDLSKFWITSWGLEDIYPGDIVRLQFLRNLSDMLSNQYHGFWMVERVVHILGHGFATRLLLTRNGVNTIEETMLVEAAEKNRKKK